MDFLPPITCADVKYTRGDSFRPIAWNMNWADVSLKSEWPLDKGQSYEMLFFADWNRGESKEAREYLF